MEANRNASPRPPEAVTDGEVEWLAGHIDRIVRETNVKCGAAGFVATAYVTGMSVVGKHLVRDLDEAWPDPSCSGTVSHARRVAVAMGRQNLPRERAEARDRLPYKRIEPTVRGLIDRTISGEISGFTALAANAWIQGVTDACNIILRAAEDYTFEGDDTAPLERIRRIIRSERAHARAIIEHTGRLQPVPII